jgi:biopolymer transport protein ExbD
MAFSLGGSSGGLRRRRRFGGSNGTLSEINIVPLVDVVLVLLIIFMLTAHVMDYGLKVDVPKVKITDQTNDLTAQLARQFKDQKKVYVAADKSVRWNMVAQVMAELKAGQFEIVVVTKPLESKGK